MKFNKDVQIRKEKFGTVIFETLKEKVFVTNETGADIIRMIQENKEREAIINELADGYKTDTATIAGEVREFINNLVCQEVLTVN